MSLMVLVTKGLSPPQVVGPDPARAGASGGPGSGPLGLKYKHNGGEKRPVVAPPSGARRAEPACFQGISRASRARRRRAGADAPVPTRRARAVRLRRRGGPSRRAAGGGGPPPPRS